MAVADEIVAALEVLGLQFNISNAVLGLTVLAWGNSVGDLFANVAVAKSSYPQMAVAATFAGRCVCDVTPSRFLLSHSCFFSGPMFNLLVGLGLAATLYTSVMMPPS